MSKKVSLAPSSLLRVSVCKLTQLITDVVEARMATNRAIARIAGAVPPFLKNALRAMDIP